MKLDARGFFDKFTAGVTNAGIYVAHTTTTEFTEAVKKCVADIIGDSDYRLNYYAEYYRIDYTAWYAERDIESLYEMSRDLGFKKSEYCWNMLAAVEHENDNWDYEVFKLGCINCPLRVVIGYNDKESDCKKLDYIAKRLSALDSFVFNTEKGQEFMIILGNNKKENAYYRGYLYNAEAQKFVLAF